MTINWDFDDRWSTRMADLPDDLRLDDDGLPEPEESPDLDDLK